MHWRNSHILCNHHFSNLPFLHILVSFCIYLTLHQSFINSNVNHAILMHTLLHSLLLEKAEWLPYRQHVCLFCYDTNMKLNVRRQPLRISAMQEWEELLLRKQGCIMVSKNLVIPLPLHTPAPPAVKKIIPNIRQPQTLEDVFIRNIGSSSHHKVSFSIGWNNLSFVTSILNT